MNTKFEHLIYVALILILLAGIVVIWRGVGTAPKTTENVFAKAQNGKPFYMTGTNRSHPVVRIMEAGFQAACDDYGLTCQLLGVEGEDIPGKIARMEQGIALGSSGIVDTVHDKAEIASALKAVQADIPIINAHFPIVQGDIPGLLAWVAPNNVAYAASAAVAMADKLQCKGKVSVTQGGLNEGENAVSKSFIETLKATCLDIVVLDVQIENYDPAQAEAATTAIIQANPDLSGAFSTTGGGAKAWANGLEASGKKPGEVVVMGMDASRENLDLLRSGKVYMLVGQPLYEEFYLSVVLLTQKAMGFPVPYGNELPAPLITKDTVDRYYHINDLAEAVVIK
jgi:ribose transport system substrate-binding protein